MARRGKILYESECLHNVRSAKTALTSDWDSYNIKILKVLAYLIPGLYTTFTDAGPSLQPELYDVDDVRV